MLKTICTLIAAAFAVVSFAQCANCAAAAEASNDLATCESDCIVTAEKMFWAEAERMMAMAEPKVEGACCGGTAMDSADCCGSCEAEVAVAKTTKASYKVWVNGSYDFYCCPTMAEEGRQEAFELGKFVGDVQPVVGEVWVNTSMDNVAAEMIAAVSNDCVGCGAGCSGCARS